MTDEPVRKVSAYLTVSSEVMEDARHVRSLIDDGLRYWMAPAWTRPDDPFRHYEPDLTPRLTRTIAAAQEARARIVGAVEVLRYGVPEYEDDW
jgi:hypothetical protein